MIIAFWLLVLVFGVLTYSVYDGKMVKLAIINGFMFGALYDVEEAEDENWHTVQVLLGFLSINILWETQQS